jgi:UDP-galactopyranose mutase
VGGVAARQLAEAGNKVLLVERRNHIAGNMYDEKDDHGILIQRYGPHIFHTSSEEVWRYISRFGEWVPFFLKCMVYMDGKHTPSPFNFKTIDDFYPSEEAAFLRERLLAVYPGHESVPILELMECEDPLIRAYAKFLFTKDYSLYTAKQWGVSPMEIDKSVLCRVPVRLSYQEGYFSDPYQYMPQEGFTSLFQKILDHPDIQIQLGTEAKDFLRINPSKCTATWEGESIPILYTGPLDELLGCRYGVLPYRSLSFVHQTEPVEIYQDAPVVAYPQAEGYTRITEYKKLPTQPIQGVTSIAIEYPIAYDPTKKIEPYYPVPTIENITLYQRYRDVICGIPNLYLAGRLADYQYYNMDQAIARALIISEEMCVK